MNDSGLPPRLYDAFWSVLATGDIYPQIRAIAASYSEKDGLVFVRCYLDREPTEFDLENFDCMLTEVSTHLAEPEIKVLKMTDECVFSDKPIRDLDSLDGFIYFRKEDEMHENPSPCPTYICGAHSRLLIDFEITRMSAIITAMVGPESKSLIAGTKGELRIFNKQTDTVLFSHADILLVEFSRVLVAWLEINDKAITEDLIYNSMGFEGGPVLAFRRQEAGNLLLESSLQEMCDPVLVDAEDLLNAVKNFLWRLYLEFEHTEMNLENYDDFLRRLQ